MTNYYDTLLVSQQASAQQVKHAYRCLVKIYHPDLFASGSKEQLEAEERIREINAAYAILSKTLSPENHQSPPKVNQGKTYRAHTQPEPEHCTRCGKATGYWSSVARKIALCPTCKGPMR
jgi:curved DNA-binding protein CbpA